MVELNRGEWRLEVSGSFVHADDSDLSCWTLRAVLVCAWAEKGADALGPDGLIIHSDAFPPETIVDTLGAGDTFNAAVIYTLSKGETFMCLLLHLSTVMSFANFSRN